MKQLRDITTTVLLLVLGFGPALLALRHHEKENCG